MLRSVWTGILILALPPTLAGDVTLSPSHPRESSLEQRERGVWRTFTREAQFTDVLRAGARSRCREVQPPQALTTPEPLLATAHGHMKIKVSFIVGTDGRVHSPLILESAGPTGDRRVLQMVRTWRYRPATCNGLPTETEGKVEFSSR